MLVRAMREHDAQRVRTARDVLNLVFGGTEEQAQRFLSVARKHYQDGGQSGEAHDITVYATDEAPSYDKVVLRTLRNAKGVSLSIKAVTQAVQEIRPEAETDHIRKALCRLVQSGKAEKASTERGAPYRATQNTAITQEE